MYRSMAPGYALALANARCAIEVNSESSVIICAASMLIAGFRSPARIVLQVLATTALASRLDGSKSLISFAFAALAKLAWRNLGENIISVTRYSMDLVGSSVPLSALAGFAGSTALLVSLIRPTPVSNNGAAPQYGDGWTTAIDPKYDYEMTEAELASLITDLEPDAAKLVADYQVHLRLVAGLRRERDQIVDRLARQAERARVSGKLEVAATQGKFREHGAEYEALKLQEA